MTRDDIFRMAREAGYQHPDASGRCEDFEYFDIERFADLVIAASKPETAIAEAYRCGWEAGATAARNACIALCVDHWKHNGSAIECADAIRARGEK